MINKIKYIITKYRKDSDINDEIFTQLIFSAIHKENKTINQRKKSKKKIKKTSDYPQHGIAVDASTINGNPGDSEYQGINIDTREKLFAEKIGRTSNNVAEFLAIVHAMQYVEENNLNLRIYSDSQIAIGWVHRGVCNTKNPGDCSILITEAIEYIDSLSDIVEIHKWKTKQWGENIADFGRK